MTYRAFISEYPQPHPLPSTKCVPIIHNFSALCSSAKTFIDSKKRELKAKRVSYDGISADSRSHSSDGSDIFLKDGLFLGTNHSASNSGRGQKVSIGIEAQLHLGVRFLDFEITTRDFQLCVVNSQGEYLMTGEKLFSKLWKFLSDKENFDEKIILNFREHKCENYVLLPTLELLAVLILSNPSIFVLKSQYKNRLSAMKGVFILFGPQGLNLALGGYSSYNWGDDSLTRIQPMCDGKPSCILSWVDLQRFYNYDAFPNWNQHSSRLVWLDISDPLYRGEAGHEFSSIRDAGLLFPNEEARFNIISFSSICANEIQDFIARYSRLSK